MTTTVTGGDWSTSSETTGDKVLDKVLGWAFPAIMAFMATGSELQASDLQQQLFGPGYVQGTEINGVTSPRTPSEDLVRIQEVFKPAVSDLAAMMDVSRQSIYNWINGGHIKPEHADRLRVLAEAADLLEESKVKVATPLLKRKFAHGRTLFQVAQDGGSVRDAALMLVEITRQEVTQRARLDARFARRPKTPATDEFDFPQANDIV